MKDNLTTFQYTRHVCVIIHTQSKHKGAACIITSIQKYDKEILVHLALASLFVPPIRPLTIHPGIWVFPLPALSLYRSLHLDNVA